ncbi:MAG: YbjN domain-containing protein [Micropepsaceae bacterium]
MRLLVLSLFALLLLSPVSSAKPLAANGISRNEMVSYLKAKGLPATREADDNKLQIVKSTVDGVNFDVYFFECEPGDDGHCKQIQLAAGWSLSATLDADKTNIWNREHRFMRAYTTPGNTALYGELDMVLAPNGSTGLIDANFDLWKLLLAKFRKHFDI